MGQVPDHELAKLRSLQGYDQMLEMDRVCRTYGLDEPALKILLTSSAAPSSTPEQKDSTGWDTSHKDRPVAAVAQQPTMIDKDRLRYEYDPSRAAAARREQVSQAILCSACGVALGIPDVRPIKVTCPSCLTETMYTS
ncbi:hypothetical protein N8392_01985 [Candidatus Poseidonia sp.]|nr:hypothetical protein [Poseidonia sp.]